MNERTRSDSRSAERAAAEWLVTLDAGPVDAATEAEFRAWLAAHPEHEGVFARCEAAMFLTDKLRGDPELGWAFDDAAGIAGREPRVPRMHGIWGWLARPALAWSVTGVAVAVATTAVLYRPTPVAPTPPSREFVMPGSTVPPIGLTLDSNLPQASVELPGRVVVDARSVAVLPFVSENGEAFESGDIGRFAATLHGQIVSQLAAVPGFYVIEPRSVLPYSDLGMAPRDIAVQLGVRGVVQGRVQLEDDNVRVNVQLTDAANDSLLLEDDYDRTVANLESIEADIATDIALALADVSRMGTFER